MKKQVNNKLAVLFSILLLFIFIQGCASSDLSRGAASEADKAHLDTDYALSHSESSVSDTYQNTSQTTKGAIIGGAAGAAVSGLNSGVSLIPGIAVGAIFGGALGAYIDAHTTLEDKLENRGVKVFILGDQVMLVLPSVLVFNERTSNIRFHAYSTLDLVAQFINRYPNMSVNVAAYSSACEAEVISVALTQQQAASVVKYLWGKGVNTRLLSATGYGGQKLVTANKPEWNSENNRVEITLEKLPV